MTLSTGLVAELLADVNSETHNYYSNPYHALNALGLRVWGNLNDTIVYQETYTALRKHAAQRRTEKAQANPPTCLNCKWAKWLMTSHNPPRIKTNSIGQCTFVATAVTPMQQAAMMTVGYNIFSLHPHTDCAVWEAKGDGA